MLKRRITIGLIISAISGAVMAFLPRLALAQVAIDDSIATELNLVAASDLRLAIIRIVQWFLGFLGLAAVIIMMYAGFLWMTARGNADQIKRAKKVLINALIGLIIILMAWAIVFFIVRTLPGVIGNTCGNSQCDAGAMAMCP